MLLDAAGNKASGKGKAARWKECRGEGGERRQKAEVLVVSRHSHTDPLMHAKSQEGGGYRT